MSEPEPPPASEDLLKVRVLSRRGRLGACTRKINEIKALMTDAGNVDAVNDSVQAFKEAVDEFKNAHKLVQELLSEEEKENDYNDWFEPRITNLNYFLKDVETWKRDIVQSTIRPADSISNVSQKSKSSSSSRSSTSRTSSVSSELKKAKAEQAAALARVAALKEKHVLQMEEAKLKLKMEQIELEADLAASTAKIKTLQSEEVDQPPSLGDGMNEYYSSQQEPDSMEGHVEFMQLGAVPKTPLQQTIFGRHKSSPRRLNTAENKTQNKNPTESETEAATYDHNASQTEQVYSDVAVTADNENLNVVIQRQNDIAELIVNHQNMSLLPPRNIPVFDGNPLEYQSFVHAFEQLIEDKTKNDKDRLYYLEQFTSGLPRDLVRSCLHMEGSKGYREAKQLLKEHFGNEIKVSGAYLDKALNWTAIKAEDGEMLYAYAMYLRGCCNAMQDLQYLEELEIPSNLRLLASKLPYKLRERWRTTAYEIQQKTGRRVRFKHLVEFVENHANMLLDPLFGDLQDQTTTRKTFPRGKSELKSIRGKNSSFATSIITEKTGCAIKQSVLPPLPPETIPSPIIPYCGFCQGKHNLIDCLRFKTESHDSKVEFLRSHGYCFGCLLKGHLRKNCKRRLMCQICQMRHPTVLHIVSAKVSKKDSQTEAEETPISSALVSASDATGAGRECALAIVPVRVKVAKGDKYIQTYAFLDPGSTATFCTESLMNRLNLKGRRTEILLRTMGQEKPAETYEVRGLEVGDLEGCTYLDLPKVYTQDKIPVSKENMITQADLERWPHLNNVHLKKIEADIELLIGTDVPRALEPWKIINSHDNGPYAVETVLGWVVTGPLGVDSTSEYVGPIAVSSNRISVTELKDLLIRQYNQDFSENMYDEKNEMSVEDKCFMKIASGSSYIKDGHYHLPLPFRNENKVMPDNYKMVKERTLHLMKKFKKDALYAEEYTSFMEDILKKGYAEKVPLEQLSREDGHVWHIPHHGVYHKRKHKLRVVFDCTSSFQGTSLNKELLQGPDLTNTLIGVLLRFRQEPIAVMADIEAMFYQVYVDEKDRDFLRFLWWPEGDTSKSLEVYRMKVHLFGSVSSPSIANFALRQTAADNQKHYSDEVIKTIKSNFYVDDCLRSVATVNQAIKLVTDLTKACSEGGFTLTKWVSNSHEVLASIPELHRAGAFKELDLDKEKLKEQITVETALGLHWDTLSDTFSFKVTIKSRPATRRGLLSTVSSIFDPLGFLSPFTLKAKLLLQELCKAKYGWDHVIPQEFAKPWQRWLKELNLLHNFQVARCMKPENFDPVETAELHHFCDASESGCGTVSYLRLSNHQGQIHICFIFGKARVAPLKQMTIPRLELTAATLAVKVDRMLKKELQVPLKDSTFWTDSTSVLKYIHNQTKRFHTFVSNRVAVIHDLSHTRQWRYVSSKVNPADDASRGIHVESFLRSKWLTGPDYLSGEKRTWPKPTEGLEEIPANDPEVRKEITVNSVIIEDEHPVCRLIKYHSSWIRLQKSVAWILKVKRHLLWLSQQRKGQTYLSSKVTKRLKDQHETRNLSVEDMQDAEKAIICFEQRRYFHYEFTYLEQGKPLSSRSTILKLDPMLDDGILRVGGRINKSAMPIHQKNPIILPKGSHLSKIVLQYIHHQVGHSGRSYMLSKLRQKFWLPHANSLTRKIIKSCVFCRRMQAKPGEQKMSDLPEDRLFPDLPPFSHVGIDYFGPIEVKRGRAQVKRWGVIFTCLVTRAVHLEMANFLTTDSCINAIRRFICRRGSVMSIRTDCGTNFVGAQKELQEALRELNHQKIQSTLLAEGIKWSFNPPFGAHHGGVWERLIRLIKKTLTSVLKEQTLDDETLSTALCEVEAILNDRPITSVSNDPNELEPLTPNHLLQLKGKATIPPGVFEKTDQYSRRRWRQAQYLADLFWRRWIREYLPLMQERSKWNSKRRNFSPGDLVVLVDDSAPRSAWTMGRVMKIFPDAKGFVRRVLVKTKANVIQRPINKLCLLMEAAG